MDKILFRAKEKKNNTWVYGSYIQKGDTHLILPKGQYRSKKIHLYTLGQYVTTDPYGHDVYEGDILNVDDEYLALVDFDNERRGFVLKIPPATYLGYEYKNREPKYEMLCKIADLLEISIDDLLGRKEPRLKDNLMKIKNKVMLEVNKQNKQWGDESELTPHQWLGLVQEEVGEIAQAVNETYLPNKTKTKLGGKENIQKEIYQAAALLIRFSEKIEGE